MFVITFSKVDSFVMFTCTKKIWQFLFKKKPAPNFRSMILKPVKNFAKTKWKAFLVNLGVGELKLANLIHKTL